MNIHQLMRKAENNYEVKVFISDHSFKIKLYSFT